MPDLIREEIATGSEEERSDLSTNILNGKTLEIHNVNTKLVYLNDYYVRNFFKLFFTFLLIIFIFLERNTISTCQNRT